MLHRLIPKNISVGRYGENTAVKYLKKKGYEIHCRNFRCGRLGEIDIVASIDDVLVFIEVKTRSSLAYGTPEESINWLKRKTLIRAAYFYINSTQRLGNHRSFRIDVIAIILQPKLSLIHYTGLFQSNGL